MKKIFLIRGIAPDAYGGAESYQLQLAKILRKNGFEPIIVTPSKKLIELSSEEKILTIEAPYNKMQNWSGWRNILLPIYVIWQIKLIKWYKKQIKKYNPDIINIQSRDEWIAATIAGKKAKIKILWTDHADFRSWVLKNIKKTGKNIIGKKIARLMKVPEKIIMISDYEAESLRKTLYPKKIKNLIIIKNGAIDDLKKYKEIKSKPNSFCYVGRITNEKGIGELLDAFRIVHTKKQEVKLELYGDGMHLQKYKKLAATDKNIIFHGYVKNTLENLAKSDIFILPSHKEGLSLALAEAAMMEKTIIATNVGGCSEIIINGKTGLLIPAQNTKKMAEAMLRVIENRELAHKLAKNVRKHYENNFNFEKNIKEKLLPILNN